MSRFIFFARLEVVSIFQTLQHYREPGIIAQVLFMTMNTITGVSVKHLI